MIESGSLTPGIDASMFALPAGTALRYERPDTALGPLLPGYAVLDSDPAVWTGPDSWVLPGGPRIWIVLTDAPITVSVRNRPAAALGAAMIFGGSSRAMPVTSQGGVSVVIDISPAGWARFFTHPAEDVRDRVTPLDRLIDTDWTNDLIALLHASDRAAQVKPLLDAFFAERLPAAGPDEDVVRRIDAALWDDALGSSAAVAEAVGLTPRVLLRMTTRYFGYGPTLLRRRTRFLRALTAMLIGDAPGDVARVQAGYYDATHFLRDANDFLGLTPRRFLAMPMPYLRAVLRARMLVMGAPLSLLDRPMPAPAGVSVPALATA
ncbi:helix-turn-helix domain-containing protein [Sphingomonas sp. RS2018]